jgi:Methyltransferase domain
MPSLYAEPIWRIAAQTPEDAAPPSATVQGPARKCPFCGGRLELVMSLFHVMRRNGTERDDEIADGILGCQCCIFPVIAGIPILHARPQANTAREHVRAGRPELGLRTMVGLEDDRKAAAFEAAAASDTATYRDIVDAFGPNFEGAYFLYRFSDPTYLVAHAVVRAVGRTVLHGERRALDACGGSGHLTRSLLDLSKPAPVLADLYFAKIWLARRFTAPGCEGVCCDANTPLPFAKGAFGLAICSDAFMYIWHKRQFIGEMARLVDDAPEPGAVVISHTHNERTWSSSHGQALSPEGYRSLFESMEPRLFAEANLFTDVVNGGPLDLSRQDSKSILDSDPALTIIGSRHPGVFANHRVELPGGAPRGEYRLNPLYAATAHGDQVELALRFPNEDYAAEFGNCRKYLPEAVRVSRAALDGLVAGRVAIEIDDLIRQRVILDPSEAILLVRISKRAQVCLPSVMQTKRPTQ